MKTKLSETASKFLSLIESATGFAFADVDDQEVCDGAWSIAEESSINILSDMELMGAVIATKSYTEELGPVANDVVGAWFGGSRGNTFSFDLVVDPAYQRNGIGRMMFEAALAFANDYERVELDVVNPHMIGLVKSYGFENEYGRTWSRSNYT